MRQDYPGSKELVILSDAPGQHLSCAAPGVRVVNLPARLPSLGTKYNALVALARGELLLPWEDDDLSLPHRIRQAVERLAGGAPFFNPHALWYWHRGQAPRRDGGGYCHNASAYTRAAWLKAGGYPPISGAQDAAFDQTLRRDGQGAPPLTSDEVPSYVYRWNVSDIHLSGHADTERAWREHGQKPVSQGRFAITPGYRPETEAALAVLL